MALVNGYRGPRAELERSLMQAAAEDHSTAPIIVAHVVKTARAAVEESRALGEGPQSAEPIAAAARFLASPKRERFVYQSTLEAITTLRGVPKPESDEVRPRLVRSAADRWRAQDRIRRMNRHGTQTQ